MQQSESFDPPADEAVVPQATPVIDGGEPMQAQPLPAETVRKAPSKRIASAISGKRYRKRELVRLDTLRPALATFIRRDFPDLPANAMISHTELARYRLRYTEDLLQREHGEFSELDRQVAESIARQDTIAENTEEEFDEHRTFGEKVSDHLASFGGSWAFLLSFAAVLVIWMAVNIVAGIHAFDPYPFILLNLCLSCLAAVQAPIIMMSQRRQETKDRLRSENDYRVNLKAELEVRHLHEKIDYLISRQWQRLAEIQQIQMEMMDETSALARRTRVSSTRRKATDPAKSKRDKDAPADSSADDETP